EHPPTTELVPCGTADEQQCGKTERVGVDNPLDHSGGRPKLGLDRRQGYVDNGFIDVADARRQDRRCQHPRLLASKTVAGCLGGSNGAFIARPCLKVNHVISRQLSLSSAAERWSTWARSSAGRQFPRLF